VNQQAVLEKDNAWHYFLLANFYVNIGTREWKSLASLGE
jgi:hypothetical protein